MSHPPQLQKNRKEAQDLALQLTSQADQSSPVYVVWFKATGTLLGAAACCALPSALFLDISINPGQGSAEIWEAVSTWETLTDRYRSAVFSFKSPALRKFVLAGNLELGTHQFLKRQRAKGGRVHGSECICTLMEWRSLSYTANIAVACLLMRVPYCIKRGAVIEKTILYQVRTNTLLSEPKSL